MLLIRRSGGNNWFLGNPGGASRTGTSQESTGSDNYNDFIIYNSQNVQEMENRVSHLLWQIKLALCKKNLALLHLSFLFHFVKFQKVCDRKLLANLSSLSKSSSTVCSNVREDRSNAASASWALPARQNENMKKRARLRLQLHILPLTQWH